MRSFISTRNSSYWIPLKDDEATWILPILVAHKRTPQLGFVESIDSHGGYTIVSLVLVGNRGPCRALLHLSDSSNFSWKKLEEERYTERQRVEMFKSTIHVATRKSSSTMRLPCCDSRLPPTKMSCVCHVVVTVTPKDFAEP